jgi:carbamoyl-phosphate synthase small subunit
VPAIQGLDTRAFTRKLRVRGAMNGFIATADISEAEAVERARQWPGLLGVDHVKEVSHPEPFAWDPEDQQSASFNLVRGQIGTNPRHVRDPMPPADIPIVAYDFGIKYNILRRLRQHGFRVQVVPAIRRQPQPSAYNRPAFSSPTGRAIRPRSVTQLKRSPICADGDSHVRDLSGAPTARPGAWRQDISN